MKKILIVEDEAPLREEVVAWLRYEGYQVLAAQNGREGVDLALAHLPDLIVTDILMPDMDGHAMLQQIRVRPATAVVPVVFLTARGDRQDVRYAMNMGADDYLTKPFTRLELLGMIEARLKKQSSIKRASEEALEDLRLNISGALPHELITPLTGILGSAELLKLEAGRLTPQQVSSVAGAIVESGKLLHRLVENYLLYVQLEVATGNPRQVQAMRAARCYAPAMLLHDVCHGLAAEYEREGDVRLTTHDTTVNISDTDYRKLVYELVDNALKFSEPRTPVTVTQTVADHHLTLRITDCGRGMEPEQIGRVGAFMQFERDIYEQQGSGLGLSLARQLVRLYGGDFDLQSGRQAGVQVTVTLPCSPHEEPAAMRDLFQ